MEISRQTFGETIRNWRKQKGEPLRIVAAAIEIDSTLLSKIERGERLPTEKQILNFARYFKVPVDDLLAKVIADKIIFEYGYQDATLQALQIAQERITIYTVNSNGKPNLDGTME